MRDIDEMDMIGYIKVRAWNARRNREKMTVPKKAFIDTVWPGMTANV
jgi:hypothetical protein